MIRSDVKRAIEQAVVGEPFARLLGIVLVGLDDGFSQVEMIFDPHRMNNIYGRAHGGAIFGLIDEAFETASQTDGTIAVALNVSVTYVASPLPGQRLRAQARRVSQTKQTALYGIEVHDDQERLLASCQALAFRTGKTIPFLDRPAEHAGPSQMPNE
jgi:acyl-CoA thioesterase